MDEIKDIQNTIDRKIMSVFQDYQSLDENFIEVMQYVLDLKGKRIRPLLMILSYKLFKNDINTILNQAVAIELFHCFTLIHDDIMDNADKRRQKKTVNKIWGNNVAILAGDILLIQAYKYLLNTSDRFVNDIMLLFTDMSMKLCEGQFIDIKDECEIPSTEQYIHMITGKTAVLLASCLKLGAILGEASTNDRELLYKLGINIGIAFQIEDDLLDIYSEQSISGKNVNNDILNRKKTFLLLKAIEYGDEEQRNIIYNYLHSTNVNFHMVNSIKQIYDVLKVSDLCKEVISSYYTAAENCINSLSVKEVSKETLKKLIKLLRNRNY